MRLLPIPCSAVVCRCAAALVTSVFLSLACAPRALAQAKGDVAVQLTAKKVVMVAGKEVLKAAERAKPGDVLEYEAVYQNTSKAAVKNLQATVPLPQGLALVAGTSRPPGPQASSDGKTFAPMPLLREVKKPDGTTEQQPVPLSEYRALRWTVPELAAGASTTVSVRARVVTNAPTN